MSCLDYRRGLLAGEGESQEMRAHRLQCSACAEAFAEHAAFERELRRGLDVPVPAALADRLVRAHGSGRRRFLAAASVAVVAAGAGAYAWVSRADPLAMACIDFVMKEEAKSIMMGAMPRAEAEAALAPLLPYAHLERIGKVRHIAPCPFNGATAYHVVLAVPQGKVTLLIMPQGGEYAGRLTVHDGMHARVVALRQGGVGIVSSDAAVLAAIAGALGGRS